MTSLRRVQILAAMLFGGIVVSYLLVAPKVYNDPEGADFSTFYTASTLVQRGQSRQLYDWDSQTRVQSEFSPDAAARHLALPYMRPPFEALLLLPLSFLPYREAFEIWIALSLVLIAVTAALLHWRIQELRRIPWWLYYLAVFSYGPVAHGLALGQDHALLFLCFALVLIFLREGKDFAAGCCLGFALIKFQIVLPFLLVLLLKRQWRVLRGFAAIAVISVSIGVWLLGWCGALAYPVYLWRLNQMRASAGIYPSIMPNLRGLLQGWRSPWSASLGLDITTGLFSLALVFWVAREWNAAAPRDSRTYSAGLAAAFLGTIVAGYHVFSFDLCLLFPVALLAASLGWHNRELDWTTRVLLLAGAAALLFGPLYLLLTAAARLNLLALVLLWLTWAFLRAIAVWRSEEFMPSQVALPAR